MSRTQHLFTAFEISPSLTSLLSTVCAVRMGSNFRYMLDYYARYKSHPEQLNQPQNNASNKIVHFALASLASAAVAKSTITWPDRDYINPINRLPKSLFRGLVTTLNIVDCYITLDFCWSQRQQIKQELISILHKPRSSTQWLKFLVLGTVTSCAAHQVFLEFSRALDNSNSSIAYTPLIANLILLPLYLVGLWTNNTILPPRVQSHI